MKTSTFRVIGHTLLLIQPVILRTNIHLKSVRGVIFKGRGKNGSNLMKFALILEKCRYEHSCSKCNKTHWILKCAKSKPIINDMYTEYYSLGHSPIKTLVVEYYLHNHPDRSTTFLLNSCNVGSSCNMQVRVFPLDVKIREEFLQIKKPLTKSVVEYHWAVFRILFYILFSTFRCFFLVLIPKSVKGDSHFILIFHTHTRNR